MLDGFRSKVEEELREILTKGSAPLLGLNTMNCYHMGFCDRDGKPTSSSKGKYMRPIFCLAMCAALGGKPEQALSAAASIEIAHRTSLILDDIQDNGVERNNQPTVWSIWGANQAINAGFTLSCYSRLALLRSSERGVPNIITLKISSVLEKAVIELCWGQYRDISFMDGRSVGLEDYLGMVRGKTSALFGAACEVGALIAGSNDPVVELARDFGIKMGIAFQIHDDYLGVWGEEDQIGKTANDLIEKKRSLPVVLALEMAPTYPKTDRYTIEKWLSQEIIRPEEAAIFKACMEKDGIPERVREMEMQYIIAAREKLDALPILPKWQEELSELLSFLTKREL